jgi:hypothetical protein
MWHIFSSEKMLKYRTKYKKYLEKMNVPRIASNISGVTPAQCIIERPRRERSLKINEFGTWPLSKPRCTEEKEGDYENGSNKYKRALFTIGFFFPILLLSQYFFANRNTADVSLSSDGVQQ